MLGQIEGYYKGRKKEDVNCKERMTHRRVREILQGIFQVFVNLHYGCLIPASVAIIWSAEDGDDVPFLRPIETVHDKLHVKGVGVSTSTDLSLPTSTKRLPDALEQQGLDRCYD